MTLRELSRGFGGSDALPCWYLSIANHSVPSMIGRFAVVAAGEELTLGRESGELGDRALDDPRISRVHCRVRVSSDGVATLEDLESTNGTLLNGQRIRRSELTRGAVIALSQVVLVVHRAPALYLPSNGRALLGQSWHQRTVLDALRGLGDDDRAVIVEGESDCGELDVAEELDWLAGGNAPIVLDAREGYGRTPSEIDELIDNMAEALVTRTVILGLKGLTLQSVERLQKSLLSTPPRPRRLVLVWGKGLAIAGLALSEAAKMLGALPLSLKPLRERPEDLPALLRRSAMRQHGAMPALSARLVEKLLMASLPGNIATLDRFVRVALGPSIEARVEWRDTFGLLLGSGSSEDLETRLSVHSDGQAFVMADGREVSLRRRAPLSRMLHALVDSFVSDSTDELSVAELVAVAWPGERLLSNAGPTRVYAAIAALRKMGLREHLTRGEQGYRLAHCPDEKLAIVPGRDAARGGAHR
ncbi:MAG: FHA domain-containing protein [Deltaproteobacteria bacterium]|nr:FHA domain-containing protein [Deltaproteobacteria bacterium]